MTSGYIFLMLSLHAGRWAGGEGSAQLRGNSSVMFLAWVHREVSFLAAKIRGEERKLSGRKPRSQE